MIARYLFLFFTIGVSLAGARVHVEGNRRFSDREILRIAGIERDADFVQSATTERIVDSLIARDYLFAKAEVCGDSDDVLQIFEGELAVVRTVRINGDSVAVLARTEPELLVRNGAIFRWRDLEHDLSLILSELSNNGFPFAQIELERLEADSIAGEVDVTIRLRAGAYSAVEFVQYSGVVQTNRGVLDRAARLATPFEFDELRLRESQERLKRLDFLDYVSPPNLVYAKDGSSGVEFKINEARATQIDAIAGFVPKGNGKGSDLTGAVRVDFINLLGTGRAGHIRWERPNARVQDVALRYREPWLFGSPVAAFGEFEQRVEDTLYVTRNVGLGIDLDIGGGFQLGGKFSNEQVFVDSAISAQIGMPEHRTFYTEAFLSVEGRDVAENPTRGAYFSTFGGSGARRREAIGASAQAADFVIRRAGADAEGAATLARFWVADLAGHARVFQSDEPEVLRSDLFRLGGARTIRGYHEEQFSADRAGWGSAELRYLLGEKSRVFGFFDAGVLHRPQGTGSTTDTVTSYGAGVRLDTRLGIAGFDYGIGEGDAALSGKVHVSLTSQF